MLINKLFYNHFSNTQYQYCQLSVKQYFWSQQIIDVQIKSIGLKREPCGKPFTYQINQTLSHVTELEAKQCQRSIKFWFQNFYESIYYFSNARFIDSCYCIIPLIIKSSLNIKIFLKCNIIIYNFELYNNKGSCTNNMDSNPIVFLNDGNPMPLLGLGTMNFKPNDKNFNLNDFIMNAAKIGYTHFDINPGNNQVALGDALKLVFQAKKPKEDQDGNKIPDQFQLAFPRQHIFISYKVYNNDSIQKSIKSGLQQMKLEYFDLVMLNCPTSPPPAPVEAGGDGGEPKDQPADGEQKSNKRQSMMTAWKVIQKCKQKGLCKSIGVSNFTIQALLFLYPFAKIKPTVNQIETHPYLIQKNMVSLCKKIKVVPIAYCPLLRGGKDQKQPLGDKIDYLVEPALKQLSVKYAKSIPQVILNYQICRGVAVVPKTQKLDHLNDNFNVTDFQLLQQDVAALEHIDKQGKVKVYQLKNLPLWRGEDPLC